MPPRPNPPRARSLEDVMTIIYMYREYSRTGLLPPPSARVYKLSAGLTVLISATFPSFDDLGELIISHVDFILARTQHTLTLAHHIALGLFDIEQLPCICTLLQVAVAPYAYIDAQRVPVIADIAMMMRVRTALDNVVRIYIERAKLVMNPAPSIVVPIYAGRAKAAMNPTWQVLHPRATGEPVFEMGEDEAAVKNIERAFIRVWTIGQIICRSDLDMHRLRNRAVPHRYDAANQTMFWAFMQRIPAAEVDIMRGCIARLSTEESQLGYVLELDFIGMGNLGDERRIARHIRDLLFWSYDFGVAATLLD